MTQAPQSSPPATPKRLSWWSQMCVICFRPFNAGRRYECIVCTNPWNYCVECYRTNSDWNCGAHKYYHPMQEIDNNNSSVNNVAGQQYQRCPFCKQMRFPHEICLLYHVLLEHNGHADIEEFVFILSAIIDWHDDTLCIGNERLQQQQQEQPPPQGSARTRGESSVNVQTYPDGRFQTYSMRTFTRHVIVRAYVNAGLHFVLSKYQDHQKLLSDTDKLNGGNGFTPFQQRQRVVWDLIKYFQRIEFCTVNSIAKTGTNEPKNMRIRFQQGREMHNYRLPTQPFNRDTAARHNVRHFGNNMNNLNTQSRPYNVPSNNNIAWNINYERFNGNRFVPNRNVVARGRNTQQPQRATANRRQRFGNNINAYRPSNNWRHINDQRTEEEIFWGLNPTQRSGRANLTNISEVNNIQTAAIPRPRSPFQITTRENGEQYITIMVGACQDEEKISNIQAMVKNYNVLGIRTQPIYLLKKFEKPKKPNTFAFEKIKKALFTEALLASMLEDNCLEHDINVHKDNQIETKSKMEKNKTIRINNAIETNAASVLLEKVDTLEQNTSGGVEMQSNSNGVIAMKNFLEGYRNYVALRQQQNPNCDSLSMNRSTLTYMRLRVSENEDEEHLSDKKKDKETVDNNDESFSDNNAANNCVVEENDETNYVDYNDNFEDTVF